MVVLRLVIASTRGGVSSRSLEADTTNETLPVDDDLMGKLDTKNQRI
jgi:hypothetical protein